MTVAQICDLPPNRYWLCQAVRQYIRYLFLGCDAANRLGVDRSRDPSARPARAWISPTTLARKGTSNTSPDKFPSAHTSGLRHAQAVEDHGARTSEKSLPESDRPDPPTPKNIRAYVRREGQYLAARDL